MFLSLNILTVIISTTFREKPLYTRVSDLKEVVCRITIINIREHFKLGFKRCVLDNKSGKTLAK